MLATVVNGIIRSIRANKNVVAEKPVEETSEMKFRRALRNAFVMQMSLAEEAKSCRKNRGVRGKTNNR